MKHGSIEALGPREALAPQPRRRRRLPFGEARIPVYVDVTAMLPGEIPVSLTSNSFPAPPAAGQKRRLLEILYERAVAAEAAAEPAPLARSAVP